jgi:tripartite-type tricarboxylate transporter receptor subunit TctC
MRKVSALLFTCLLVTSIAVAGCAAPNGSTAGNQSSDSPSPDYPVRQIEYVVPYSAGGGVDLVARATAEYLSKEWGQPIVVVNKAGGGGTIGAEYALKQAKPDGYTVLAVNVSNTSMLAGGMANPTIKTEDHLFVSRIGEGALAFAVKADAPWNNFREFNEWVKQNPEQLTWTTVGPAGFSAFGVAEWLDTIGVDYHKTRMIVTKGASESLPKVAGGHAVLAVHSIGEMNAMAQSGKVKILAVSGSKRSRFYPDVPTTEEQGVKGLSVKWWTGVSMPKGTPDYVVKKWENAIEKMVQDPAFVQKLEAIQVDPAYANSADFTRDVVKETEYYTELGTKRGIRK